MLATTALPIDTLYRPGSIGFIDQWVEIQHAAAREAAMVISMVLCGQREFFHFCQADGKVVPMSAAAIDLKMRRMAKTKDMGMLVASLASLDPHIRFRGIALAHEMLRTLAGEHADNEANRACGVPVDPSAKVDRHAQAVATIRDLLNSAESNASGSEHFERTQADIVNARAALDIWERRA